MPVGRSVLVKVLTVDPEQGQATLTMNEKDLRLSVAECDLMYKCLYEQLMSINKYVTGALSPEDALSGLRVGQVVEATVTKITKNNVRLTVGDSEIKATAPGTLATGNYPYIICFIYCIRYNYTGLLLQSPCIFVTGCRLYLEKGQKTHALVVYIDTVHKTLEVLIDKKYVDKTLSLQRQSANTQV